MRVWSWQVSGDEADVMMRSRVLTRPRLGICLGMAPVWVANPSFITRSPSHCILPIPGFYVHRTWNWRLEETRRRGHRQRTLRESYCLAAPPPSATHSRPLIGHQPPILASDWPILDDTLGYLLLTRSPPLLLCQDLNRKCSRTWLWLREERCLVLAADCGSGQTLRALKSDNHTAVQHGCIAYCIVHGVMI